VNDPPPRPVSMAGYFKGVADSFMETDASQASGLNESAMISAVLRYPLQMDQYNQELTASQKAGNAASPEPTAPTNPFSLNAGVGPVTTYTTTTYTNVPAEPQRPADDLDRDAGACQVALVHRLGLERHALPGLTRLADPHAGFCRNASADPAQARPRPRSRPVRRSSRSAESAEWMGITRSTSSISTTHGVPRADSAASISLPLMASGPARTRTFGSADRRRSGIRAG